MMDYCLYVDNIGIAKNREICKFALKKGRVEK